MFPFLFYVGLRIGEALAINIHESIDLQKQSLHVSRMCARHDRLVNGVWKTDEFTIVDRLKKDAPGRDVPLNSDAIELIKLIYKHYEARNMDPDYLFALDDGIIPKQNNVRSMLERFCTRNLMHQILQRKIGFTVAFTRCERHMVHCCISKEYI